MLCEALLYPATTLWYEVLKFMVAHAHWGLLYVRRKFWNCLRWIQWQQANMGENLILLQFEFTLCSNDPLLLKYVVKNHKICVQHNQNDIPKFKAGWILAHSNDPSVMGCSPALLCCCKPLQSSPKLIPIRTNLFGLHYKPIQSSGHALLFHWSPKADSVYSCAPTSSKWVIAAESPHQAHFLPGVKENVFFVFVVWWFVFLTRVEIRWSAVNCVCTLNMHQSRENGAISMFDGKQVEEQPFSLPVAMPEWPLLAL